MTIKAKVFKDGDTIVDVEVKRSSAVLGRKSNSDIRIDSEHISRTHIEIKLEREKLFLKKASSKNWVVVNDVPLGDGHWIQCCSGDKIELPDGFSLQLDKGQSLAVSPKKVDIGARTGGSFGKTSVLEPKSAENKTFLKTKKSELSKATFGILILGCAVFVGVYLFGSGAPFSSSKEKSKQNFAKSKVLSAKSAPKKLAPLADEALSPESRKRIEAHIAKIEKRQVPGKLCQSKYEKMICSLSGLSRTSGEGVTLLNESLYFFLDLDNLQNTIASPSALGALKGSSEKIVMRFLCAYRAMKPAVVNESVSRKVKNIYCRFTKKDNVLNSSIAIEIEDGINFRSTDHQAAFDFFEKHSSFELFENFFAPYMLFID